ncbi:MAG: hypothetical protein ACRDIB_12730, partial [Ardenticatenaceae bacterium]
MTLRHIILLALLPVLALTACATGEEAGTSSTQEQATTTTPAEPATATTLPPTATDQPVQSPALPSATVPTPAVAATATLAPTVTAAAQPTPPPAGGILLCDELNDFSLRLPDGWKATTPAPDAMMGTTVLTNYDEEEILAPGQGQEGVFPPGTLKIDIT